MDTTSPFGIAPGSKTLGERLREARKRLGLSQQEFAERCGVHRKTQESYELGRTLPKGEYWEAIDKLGLDSVFICEGTTRHLEGVSAAEAGCHLFSRLIHELGYSEDESAAISQVIGDKLRAQSQPGLPHDEAKRLELEIAGNLLQVVKESPAWVQPLERESDIDGRLLGKVLAAVESELAQRPLGLALPPEKLGLLASTIYRQARSTGNVDLGLVRDAVALSR